ncbi:g5392 [Coccomyxa elongata]
MPTRRSTSKQNKKAYLARIIALLSLAGTSNERFLLVGGISWSGHPRRENIAFGKLSNIAGQARHQQQFGRCSVGLDRDAEKWDIVYSLLYLHEHVDFDNVDQAIYLDMDTLWMDTPRKLREEFRRMLEGNALFAMALETTDMNANGSWYRRGNSRVLPYYGDFGLNAGVLLLNLKALRASGFSNERDKIIRHFLPKKALPLGDQDILNAYASKYPRQK